MQWDDQIKGLHRIEKGDSEGWYVYYRLRNGKQRRSKIGDCRIISVKQAREIAKEILAKVALGEDPLGERKKKDLDTLGDVFSELYIEHYSQDKYIRSGYRQEALNRYRQHIEKPFGKRSIESITALEIKDWHKSLRKTPYLANRTKAILSKIFSYAESVSKIPPGSNPCRSVGNFEEKPRKRYATETELKIIHSLLTKYQSTYPREVGFIRLLMLTGCRPSSLVRARHSDIVWVGGGAILHVQGKTGTDDIILSKTAIRVLEGLPRFKAKSSENDFVVGKFPRAFWERVRQEAGCEGLRARDFRRTFGTVALSSGISRGAISELLNHKSEQTTKIYSLLVPEAKILAAKAVGEEIERMME